ncbi:MAG: glycosyltransferase N-terminal domain-containing protein [Ferruginibacter sp.]
MSLLLYNISLFFIHAGISIAFLWNPKARQWITGRKDWKQKIQNWNSLQHSEQTVWMHCASLGEFEQGRPVLEAIKKRFPSCKILISFFSPSGYEIRKNYDGADLVVYLPLDSKANVEFFIKTVKPDLVIWVKYEYWFYYLHELKAQQIPVLLISAIFRNSQPFFKWYGAIWKEMLLCFEKMFIQNRESLVLLQKIGQDDKAVLAGDTRFDRVITIAEKIQPIDPIIEKFIAGSKVIIAGSTWPDDEKLILHYANVNQDVKIILAPHEIGSFHLQEIKSSFKNSVYYSSLKEDNSDANTYHILIIDNIGMLSQLYRHATITYIGGGFGESGIHNTLEAAVFGKPVIFGPEYEKFVEAVGLVNCGAAFSITNALELEECFEELLHDERLYEKTCAAARNYVYHKKGATEIILHYIAEKRLLTN